MVIDPFNKQTLLSKLGQLSPRARVAFAGAVAVRLFPTYKAVHEKDGSGNPEKLREALEFAQKESSSGLIRDAERKAAMEAVEVLIKAAYGSASPLRGYAQDSTAAVAYVLRALTSGKTEDAVWAVQCIYETIGRFVVVKESLLLKGPQGLKGPALMEVINNSKLMQQEFARQSRDIEELDTKKAPEPVDAVWQRAMEEPALPPELIIPSNLPSLTLVQMMHLRDNEFGI